MGDGTIQLKYSVPNGIPYLEFDKNNSLIFSKTTMKDGGFKYFVFHGKEVAPVKIKKGKKSQTIEMSTNFDFVLDLSFTKIPKELKGRGKPFSPINLGFLKKLFEKHREGERIPLSKLPEMQVDIDEFNKEED